MLDTGLLSAREQRSAIGLILADLENQLATVLTRLASYAGTDAEVEADVALCSRIRLERRAWEWRAAKLGRN
jgi:hypothetical protein